MEYVRINKEVWERVKAVVNRVENIPLGAALPERPGVAPHSPLAYVRITGEAAGGGKYDGVFVRSPDSAPAATGTLTVAECGADTTTAVLIVNPKEVGVADHSLSNGVYIGRVISLTADDKPVVSVVSSVDYCDPANSNNKFYYTAVTSISSNGTAVLTTYLFNRCNLTIETYSTSTITFAEPCDDTSTQESEAWGGSGGESY